MAYDIISDFHGQANKPGPDMTVLVLLYRSFACWAARRASRLAQCRPCENVIATVELFVAGKVHFDKVQWVREFARNGASSAAFHDLTSCSPKAAAHLAAWETANDSAHAAALNVIRCAALAAGFRALGPAGHAAQEIERIFLENELKRWLRQRAEMMAGSE